MGVRRVVVAAAFAVDYNISTTTTTTGQQQHKLLSKRCHLLPFGVVGVCRKGRHLSHSSRKHCLRRIFSTFVVVVGQPPPHSGWLTWLWPKLKLVCNNNNGQRIKCWVFRINWTHNMFVSSLYRIFSFVLFCPMPTELIAQIICFFGQSLKRLTSGELKLSTMKICQKY